MSWSDSLILNSGNFVSYKKYDYVDAELHQYNQLTIYYEDYHKTSIVPTMNRFITVKQLVAIVLEYCREQVVTKMIMICDMDRFEYYQTNNAAEANPEIYCTAMSIKLDDKDEHCHHECVTRIPKNPLPSLDQMFTDYPTEYASSIFKQFVSFPFDWYARNLLRDVPLDSVCSDQKSSFLRGLLNGPHELQTFAHYFALLDLAAIQPFRYSTRCL